MQKYLDTFREMLSLRGLTNHTITAYSTYVSAYLHYLETILLKNPEDVSWQELRDYILFIQVTRNLSDRTMNACISQIRFFTLYVLHKSWDPYQLPMRKFDTYLPFVPTKEEVRIFISTLPDLKEKAMIALLYSAGLRAGEVRHLKYKDIERSNMRIHITHGKNRTDRYAVLSDHALSILSDYWLAYDKPREWLFTQVYGDHSKPVDHYYLPRHIELHEKRLGWEKRLSCHSFRHAFGTHSYENGTDLLTLKALLGHKSLNSTTIYVQLASNGVGCAVSPFDSQEDYSHV